MEDYPVELRRHPVPVVALVGNGGIQEKLKEATLREGKSALKLLHYDFGDPLPILRPPKRLSYDSYVPRGILKANWLHKIVNVEAAIIALFYDWRDKEGKDKEGKPWHARELDISQQITEMLKLFSSQGSSKPSNRILIVFVFPSGVVPDSVYEERITILRKRVDMSEKSFFALYENDFVKLSPSSSVTRLENLLKEIANMQYIEEAKRLKKEKDIINRRVLPQVYTRNHFKIAYLHEFSFDIRGSLKYYTYAYNYLREVPKDRRSIPEIKVLADYLNYKLCKLHLTNTKIEAGINDAVNQFQRHIKLYKNMIGASDRETEHWAWVSRQYEVMAQLLQKYSYGKWFPFTTNLRHPAYYYESAAFYASERKLNALKNALKFPEKKLSQYSTLQPINIASIDISRQRFVGQEIESLYPPDDPSDDSALQRAAREYFVPHSLIITSLLSKALELYESQRKEAAAVGIKETPKNDRMILYLNSLIADEFFSSADFVKAKEIYDSLAGYFAKNNKWSFIIGNIYLKALHCAQRLADIKDFVKYSLELCIPAVKIEQAERGQIQQNLMEVVHAPDRIGLSPLKHPLTIELNQFHPLLSANFQFASPEVFANSPTSFRLLLLSHFPHPFRFSSVSILFNMEEYNRKEVDEKMGKEGERKGWTLEPKVEKVVEFAITPNSLATLEAKYIILEIGDEAAPSSSIKFVWTLSDWKLDPPSPLPPSRSFLFLPTLLIKETEAKVAITLRHLPPALVNEFYRVDLKIENGEDRIESGTVFFSMLNAPPLQSEDHSFFLLSSPEGGGSDFTPIISNKGYSLGPLEAGEEKRIGVYVFSPASAKDRTLGVQLQYSTKGYATVISKKFPAPVTLPLTARCAFFTSSFASCLDPVNGTTIRSEESSIMRVEVQNKCPYPLEILAADLDLNPNALSLSSTSHLFFASERCILHYLDKFTTWFQFAPQTVGNDVNIGVFKMKWKRHPHPLQLSYPDDDETSRLIVTPTLIPPLKVSKSPFTSEVEVPPFGVVGTPMQYVVMISNHTNRMEEISLVVQESDHFVIAGTKVSTFKIFPSSKYLLSHTIVPLKSGKVPLPYFQISSKRFAKEMSGTKQKRFIYIQPQQPCLSSSPA